MRFHQPPTSWGSHSYPLTILTRALRITTISWRKNRRICPWFLEERSTSLGNTWWKNHRNRRVARKVGFLQRKISQSWKQWGSRKRSKILLEHPRLQNFSSSRTSLRSPLMTRQLMMSTLWRWSSKTINMWRQLRDVSTRNMLSFILLEVRSSIWRRNGGSSSVSSDRVRNDYSFNIKRTTEMKYWL